MKPKSTNSFRSLRFTLAGPLALMLGSTVHAADYNYGSISGTTANFSITATDQARDIAGDGTFNNNIGDVGVYWRDSAPVPASDVTFMHFDLSSLAGATINSAVNLNVIVSNTFGRDTMTGAQLSTTNTAWTYSSGGATPARTAVSGSPAVSGNFPGGSTPSWTIPQATFQGFVTTPSTFTGFALSAASNSGQHWSALPTLTGNATTAASFGITVTGATDWNAAIFDTPSSTLSVSGSGNVSGGNVLIKSGFALSVVDSATLDSGSFAGSFNNAGTLSFASSAAQTLSGAITNTDALSLAGSGNKTLSGAITNTGTVSLAGSGSNTLSGTIANTGTVAFAGSANHTLSGGISGSGSITKADSGTLTVTGASNNTGSVTVSGGTLAVTGAGKLYSNLGWQQRVVTVQGGGVLELNRWGGAQALGELTYDAGNIVMNNGTIRYTGTTNGTDEGGNGVGFTIKAGGATLETTAVGQTWNIVLDTRSTNFGIVSNESGTFNLTGAGDGLVSKVIGGGGGLTKGGTGTWTLSANNTYSGGTVVNGGTLIINGNISTSNLTTVNTDGTLGGTGTVGALTVKSGGALAPGQSPGILNTGNITLETGSNLNMELNGANAGTGGYDQLNVTGSVTLAGVLNISMGFTPVNDSLLFILVNDSNEAITGIFSNALVDGGTYTFGGQEFKISYFGDSVGGTFTGGNDVALMAIPEPNVAALLGGLGMLAMLRRRRNGPI